MNFVDIHNHSLYGIDDGPKTPAEMRRMLDEAYARGTRAICFTPHFHPALFPRDPGAITAAYAVAVSYAGEKYPDLKLSLGSELHYSPNCMNWFCKSAHGCINQNRHVLVDFSEDESANRIIHGLHELLSRGYHPILAHAERYRHLSLSQIGMLRRKDILIQADTQSFFGGFGFLTRVRVNRMLRRDLIDMVSSDAHDCAKRPPDMQACWQYIKRKKGAECAEALCASNARHIL